MRLESVPGFAESVISKDHSPAVSGLLQQLPPRCVLGVGVAHVADSAGKFVVNGSDAMAVLSHQDDHSVRRHGDDVHPIGIFKDIVVLDEVPVRQAGTVLSKRQPRRLAAQVHGGHYLPRTWVAVIVRHLKPSVVTAKDENTADLPSIGRQKYVSHTMQSRCPME